jgi:hypothetical protein
MKFHSLMHSTNSFEKIGEFCSSKNMRMCTAYEVRSCKTCNLGLDDRVKVEHIQSSCFQNVERTNDRNAMKKNFEVSKS